MSTLDLRQRLRIEVVVKDRQPTVGADERRPLAPPGQLGDEVMRRRELDVHPELVLQVRDRAQERSRVGYQLEVDVDGARTPAATQGGGTAHQIDRCRAGGGAAEPFQKAL